MTDTDNANMQIGQVAARTELSIRTIRHYDEVGLVTPSARSTGGFRLYTETDVERLLVIRRMKPLDFSLTEMKDLLQAVDTLNTPNVTAAQQTAAADYLQQCQAKTHDSINRLRKHLAYAEELDRILTTRARDGHGGQ
ncbi:MerR family transcriptional regulator [Mycobacteroides chelonae]|nr:MerR family transcriptional regulator [Mycobacteroides chelonae]OHT67064.1 MerR family transcriptional regulator [Mycobacteroides chelonae]OHT68700.1 MerR family transcriptional regulator [Mycobacteroides chelonae]OHT83608.1 MerR family transcriptional regulator [Mycobacteroides chelonae]OHU55276.1 MerR family transcriptional regulator [Mycobacteroides chelonae]